MRIEIEKGQEAHCHLNVVLRRTLPAFTFRCGSDGPQEVVSEPGLYDVTIQVTKAAVYASNHCLLPEAAFVTNAEPPKAAHDSCTLCHSILPVTKAEPPKAAVYAPEEKR